MAERVEVQCWQLRVSLIEREHERERDVLCGCEVCWSLT